MKKSIEEMSFHIIGSCVSREMFNYGKLPKKIKYLQQNPLHTLFYEGDNIELCKCKSVANVEFIKRMVYIEFNKTWKEYLFSKKADYIIIDFADCRFNYYEHVQNSKIRLAATPNVTKTLCDENQLSNYVERSVYELPKSFWENTIYKLISILKKYHSPNKIILNRVTYSKITLNKNEIVQKQNINDFESRSEGLVRFIEELFLKKIDCKVINPIHYAIADEEHRFSKSVFHYTPSTYYYQFIKLCDIISNTETNLDLNFAYLLNIMIVKQNRITIKKIIDWCLTNSYDYIAFDLCRRYSEFPEIAGRLGRLYEKGTGTNKDILKATQLYKYAFEKGIVWAEEPYRALVNNIHENTDG